MSINKKLALRLALSSLVLGALFLNAILAWPNPRTATQKKVYSRTGQEATVYGTAIFAGEPPAGKVIDMSADPVCVESNRKPTKKSLSVKNAMVANVLVYVSAGDTLENYLFETPSTPVTLERKKCNYRPHVLGLQVGQPLAIQNSDNTQHNTHPTPKANREWNQSQGIGGEPIVKTFESAEIGIPFKCNQHPWEKAYVSVFNHPFFAVTDAEGNFRIEGLPPGKYTLATWHEVLGQKSVELSLAPGEIRHTAYSFNESDLSQDRLIRQ